MNRKKEQAEIIFKAGILFGPVLKMFEHPDSYDSDERQRVAARFHADYRTFQEKVAEYTRGEPGYRYDKAFYAIVSHLDNVSSNLGADVNDSVGAFIRSHAESIWMLLSAIPVPVDSAIHSASTPFSTYCLMKDFFNTSREEILWIDRYFDQTVFRRYFRDTPKTTLITLITYPETKRITKRDKAQYAEFLDISKLFAQERGPTGYRLLTDTDFHDRWLKCDKTLLSIGSSIKELENEVPMTITKIKETPDNYQEFETVRERGIEIFGPTVQIHP